MNEPLIIAHRGASYEAPENTLAAFALAWAQDADGFECDVWLTGDGHVVCLHDADTGRVGNAGGDKGSGLPVMETTFADLQAVDVGRWKDERFAGQTPPLLREVLKLVGPRQRVFVEIKSKDGSGILAAPAVVAVIDESGLPPEQITIISFDADVVAWVKEQRPAWTVNWLTSFRRHAGVGRWSPSIDEVLRTLRETGADGLGCKAVFSQVTRSFVARLREQGYGFHLWTINEPDVARRAVELAVDSITTDRPAYIRQSLSGE
ncbi:MAG: glycerophosphodiester phosphodiesterase [Planctomycetota bacterium]